jgi:NAD-reducing hydrogenase large subunit
MARRILIDPVTRIEGHAKITIHQDESGNVTDARFHVVEFRGFETFCEGRPLWEMPSITPRICGICPVSHLLASAKACDAILSVRIPAASEQLRRLMNLAQIIQSHALSFFHLSAPDFLIGWDAPAATRNVFTLIQQQPDLARGGIRLRQFGQEIIELLGGRKIHPAWAVPGGVRQALTEAGRDRIKSRLPEAMDTARAALQVFRDLLQSHERELQVFGRFPSLFLGLANEAGLWEHYDGFLRFVDAGGNVLADEIEVRRYREFIGEAVQTDSYLKSPYYKPLGFPQGIYRVGPLARLNVCRSMGTPLADEELDRFRSYGQGTVTSSFLYHYARLIEILACLELIQDMINRPALLSPHLRADAGINQLHGVGASEAPRGTLFHDYQVNELGLIQKINLIIATGQNNLAMNRTVAQIAKHYIQGNSIPEPMLNRVEAGIRAFDPCLSCSTHADGTLALHVTLVAADGTVLDTVTRD